jgi:hypothetical protein
MKLFYSVIIILFTIGVNLLPLKSLGATTSADLAKLNTAPLVYPPGQKLYDRYPWSATYYYGITGHDALGSLFVGGFHRWPEHIQSLELSRTLDEQNFLRRLVSPLVGVVQLAGNVTLRTGSKENTIYEFDPYLAFRWANLPWNKYVNTSLAIGEGLSYVTSVPAIERGYSNDTKRLLNYLMLEATFAPPSYPRLQFVARIHHRSGAYGLYHAGNSGSNDVGVGIRYLFD